MSKFDEWLESFPQKENEALADECTYMAGLWIFNAGLAVGKAERIKELEDAIKHAVRVLSFGGDVEVMHYLQEALKEQT